MTTNRRCLHFWLVVCSSTHGFALRGACVRVWQSSRYPAARSTSRHTLGSFSQRALVTSKHRGKVTHSSGGDCPAGIAAPTDQTHTPSSMHAVTYTLCHTRAWSVLRKAWYGFRKRMNENVFLPFILSQLSLLLGYFWTPASSRDRLTAYMHNAMHTCVF